MTKKESNISANMKRLREINDWFDQADDVDIEKGIALVKEGAELILESKKKLAELENEFTEIKKILVKE